MTSNMNKAAAKVRNCIEADEVRAALLKTSLLSSGQKLDRIQEIWDRYLEQCREINPGEKAVAVDEKGDIQFGIIMPSGRIVSTTGTEIEPLWAGQVTKILQLVQDIGNVLGIDE